LTRTRVPPRVGPVLGEREFTSKKGKGVGAVYCCPFREMLVFAAIGNVSGSTEGLKQVTAETLAPAAVVSVLTVVGLTLYVLAEGNDTVN
jgi:hypothetical protein